MDIVFMGTPDFAVPCLAKLIDCGHNVKAVFSQPDRPKGRGYTLAPPPVKVLAAKHNIPVYQPTKLRDGTVKTLLEDLAPQLIVVVAYGRILPTDILALPPLGCINVHASLLPKLRGAAPIQWAVLNGDKTTGVTTMYMADGIDTGDMILAKETPIGENETSGELFERLSNLGAESLDETIKLIESGKTPRTPQNHDLSTHAPMIEKSMAFIDFTKSPQEICNLVRGMNPSPVAKTYLGGKLIKVLKAVPCDISAPPGEIADPKRFVVGCGGGSVEFITVQPEGKKAMDAGDFIRGKRLSGGEKCTPQPEK